ncbi:DUF262 domain-containing protein [Cellulomonas fimi]|uniref:DUF262 domain-containing protein n=1 Tax=Cellulomonas fimi TaxID=1708 RepID=UPI00235A1329|nr:DUF262 domain-containing protein [Cellulomonas fimi]
MAEHADEQERRALVQRQRSGLVAGELIAEGLQPVSDGPQPSPEEINQKYDRGEIRIVTEQGRYPLASITDMLGGGNYKLDPDYQRRHRWDLGQRSRLIESFIMNVPVPPIFLYEWDYNQYEVMDGLQRMTAVREFYSNGFALTGLEYWTELEGMRYDTLPSRIRAGIDRRYISSIILLKETSHGGEDPDLLKRFVFGRINTGGVQLAPQELRNALYDGPMNQLCKELAGLDALRRLWGIPLNVEALVDHRAETEDGQGEFDLDLDVPDPVIPLAWRKMVDVELVLRFFANRQRMIYYRDNLRDYLDDYLRAANGYENATIEELRRVFQDTLALAEDLFGDKAFRRARRGNWGNVPSVSIYDALMNVLSRLLDSGAELRRHNSEILEGMAGFYEENARIFNLRGQTRADLMTREILLEDYLRGFIG